MNPGFVVLPEEGARNLCLGRVLLKADTAADATDVEIGHEFSGANAGASIPGTSLFYNSTLDTSGKAVVVEPASSDDPDSIEHSETVTIDTSVLTSRVLHLPITVGLTNAYTVAAGAYVRLYTLPTICSSLKLVQNDFMDPISKPPDKWFPGVYVFDLTTTREALTNVEDHDQTQIVVRYAEVMDENFDKKDFIDNIWSLTAVLEQAIHLGGTAWYSRIPRPAVLTSTPGRVTGPGGDRVVLAESDNRIMWGDIYIVAHTIKVVDKASPAA